MTFRQFGHGFANRNCPSLDIRKLTRSMPFKMSREYKTRSRSFCRSCWTAAASAWMEPVTVAELVAEARTFPVFREIAMAMW